MKASLKTYSSQQAARRVGVSYQMLMRWVRAGLISPPGYAGRQWAAVEWTEREVERARLVLSLKNLGLSPAEMSGLLEERADLFEAGYKPLWIARGSDSGKSLVLAPRLPSLDSIPLAGTGRGKKKGTGTALIIGEAVHVPLGKTKRNAGGRKRGK